MFNNTMVPSVADIAAVTDNNRNSGWGMDGGWRAIIILFALFGWGRNGFGFGGNAGGCGCDGACATVGDVQRGFDNQGVTNKLSGLENGLCSLGYDQLAQMNTINQNANYRALHDEIVAIRMEDKNAQIAALQSQVQALNLAQSQANQNQYLINTLRPCPTPAYITCNLWAGQAAYGSCGTAYGYGCGTCC